MASFIAIIRYALLETFFCISILAKTHAKPNVKQRREIGATYLNIIFNIARDLLKYCTICFIMDLLLG